MTNKPPDAELIGIIEYHPSNKTRKKDWLAADGTLHKAGSIIMIPLTSLEVKQLRIDYLRHRDGSNTLSKKYKITQMEVIRICRYEIRDEAAACPEENEYRHSNRWGPDHGSQYNKDVNKRPRRTQRPYLSREQVIEIRLRHRTGLLDGHDSKVQYAAELGIHLESLVAIIDGQLFMTMYFYPNDEQIEEFLREHSLNFIRW